MKKFYFLAALFLALAVSVGAQTSDDTAQATASQQSGAHDTIVLLNGNIIDAKVEEITPTQIKYRRSDNLSGPLIIISKSEVLSIKYENGNVEVINSSAPNKQTSNTPRLNPKKLYTGISFEPSGFISGGPSATLEFSKGSVNSSVHVSIPSLALNSTSSGFGFGAGASLNYYWNGPIGGFFFGGLFEWNTYPFIYSVYNPYQTYNAATDSYSGKYISKETRSHNFILALNGGYKFILKNGIYFRTGVSAGMAFSNTLSTGFYYKPDIATGYIF